MSLTTFAGLKASVATFINRTDLTTQIPDFVVLAESMIRKDIKTRSQETIATGTLTGETLAQPSGLLETRVLTVGSQRLSYVTPEQYSQLQYNTVTGGKYTVRASSFYILGGTLGDTYELTYLGAFVALSADADTNFVLTNAPEVYLWASLFNAAIYMKDPEAGAYYKGLYDAAMSLLNHQEKNIQFSGPLTVRPENRE